VKNFLATITNRIDISDELVILNLTLPHFDGKAEPGQFVMIKVSEMYDPFLRRPYSILECGKEKMSVLVKNRGKGSSLLTHKKRNDVVEIFGPLGNGFPLKDSDYPLLVAGGIGIAPLWFLGRKLTVKGREFSFIFGEMTSSTLGEMVDRGFGGNAFLVTDDGSKGLTSNASDAVPLCIEKLPQKNISIYACGPVEMLKKIIAYGIKESYDVFVSLEEKMACGIGVCLGCSIKKKNSNEFFTVCKDGPVFKGDEVEI
jgi:dihydroorotate dehydrogenase electron transfer subunit